jgi:NTP pyrophosphatase (non-canonical NTP hydrolase)
MSLNELQREVSDYDKKLGWTEDKAGHIVLHILEELGEVSRHVIRYEGYKKEKYSKSELGQEMTDVLYLTLKLANKFDIKLDGEWELMWERFKGKTSRGL